MAALRLQRDSAERFAKAEGDLWFPTVSAVGSAGIIPWHDSNLSDRFAAVGVNINFPIFNGRLFSARRAEADFKFKAEDQSLRNLEDQISRDVRIAWLNADTANQRLGLTQQLLDQASLAFDLAQARYNLGLGSIVELSQAQLDKTQAEIEQASAKYEYLTERAALAYQIGSLK
jgi:outer membrane protein